MRFNDRSAAVGTVGIVWERTLSLRVVRGSLIRAEQRNHRSQTFLVDGRET